LFESGFSWFDLDQNSIHCSAELEMNGLASIVAFEDRTLAGQQDPKCRAAAVGHRVLEEQTECEGSRTDAPCQKPGDAWFVDLSQG
jgi:hypothetical protein